MSLLKVILLAVVQGLAELLPVSSSAHVVVAEKLMGMDPSSPPMTLLLVMLHTGTMFAVVVYFWRQWRDTYFRSAAAFKTFVGRLILASVLTAIVGEILLKIIEKTLFRGTPHAQIEDLFGRLDLVAPALAAAGVLILVAGLIERRNEKRRGAAHSAEENTGLTAKQAGLIGAVQGLSLPFRGFSRSGSTISVGMLCGVAKSEAERFSFALAVVLTPAAVAREAMRLAHAEDLSGAANLVSAALPSLLGAFCAFLAGLLALKWLSQWLERGRWYIFGIYCLVASVAVMVLHFRGY